jgi:hypothetical protein
MVSRLSRESHAFINLKKCGIDKTFPHLISSVYLCSIIDTSLCLGFVLTDVIHPPWQGAHFKSKWQLSLIPTAFQSPEEGMA